jgi:hypothetical protein
VLHAHSRSFAPPICACSQGGHSFSAWGRLAGRRAPQPAPGALTRPPRAPGAKLKQKAALAAAPAPPLEVLEDADLAVASPLPPPAAPPGALRRRLDAGGLEEDLQHDPLRLHKVAGRGVW